MSNEEAIQPINERFDQASAEAFDLLQSLPEKITSLRGHPRRMAGQVVEMITVLSEFIDTAEEYRQSQCETLLVRNASNNAFLSTYNTLQPHIEKTIRMMPAILTAIRSSVHTCKHKGKKYYMAVVDNVSAQISDESQNVEGKLRLIAEAMEQVVSGISAIAADENHGHWVVLLNAGKERFLRDPQNKAMMNSYNKDTIRYLHDDLILSERKQLWEEYHVNPIVVLHGRYNSDLVLLCSKIRKGDYSQEQMDNYYEYVCKLDAVCVAEKLFEEPFIDTSDTLNNYIFRSNTIIDQARLAAMRQWLSDCFWKEGDDKSRKVDTTKRNQLFIPYYVLCSRDMLDNTCVPLFVRQVAEWFPDVIRAGEEDKWEGAIYDEMANWKCSSRELVSYNDLADFQHRCSMRESKCESFRLKMQECQMGLIAILKRWYQGETKRK